MGKKADAKIKDFIKKVKKKYKVEKAILFGSRARGDNFNDSDYDVIIVSPDFINIFFTQRIAKMYNFWKHYPLEIEPICYTPEEFEKMKKRIGLVKKAVEEGIEI
ncbi:nucleotidyltransferase domain-containing protein [Candidatus Pacearchaeota archaeon]|nr:nucleotidyltransferase domain-containing protein [Candidatus Pacearchaeota archaeon]